MRKTKLVSLVLTVMTVSALAAVPAMASTQLKAGTVYKTDNTKSGEWIEYELKDIGEVKKNTRVYDIYSSDKDVIDPVYVTYKVEKTTAAVKYVGKIVTNKEYTIKLNFYSEKNGSALLKFTVDGKRYKKIIKVKKWTNPIKYLRFTKCSCSWHNYKSLFKNKNTASDYLDMNHTKNAKVRVKAAKEMVLPVLSLKTSKAYVVKATFVNVNNGAEEEVTLSLSAY